MFKWIKDFFRSGSELLDAEVRLAQHRLQQFGLLFAAFCGLAMLGSLALAAIAVGAAVLLEPVVGLGWSVTIVAVVVLLGATGGAWALYAATSPEAQVGASPRDAADAALREFRDLLAGTERTSPRDRRAQPPRADVPASSAPQPQQAVDSAAAVVARAADKVVTTAVTHPIETASAIFAVMSLLGFRRVSRMTRAMMGAVSVGAMAYRTVSALANLDGCADHPAAPHMPRHRRANHVGEEPPIAPAAQPIQAERPREAPPPPQRSRRSASTTGNGAHEGQLPAAPIYAHVPEPIPKPPEQQSRPTQPWPSDPLAVPSAPLEVPDRPRAPRLPPESRMKHVPRF